MAFNQILHILVFTFSAHSSQVYPWEIKCSLAEAQNKTTSSTTCEEKKPSTKPTCKDLTEDVCKELYSQENKGNMKVADGQLLLGKSKKSKLSEASLANINALLDSEKNLPADLKAEVAPLFEKYRNLMKREEDSKKWSREKSILDFEINNAISDVADARFKKAYPAAAAKKEKDLTIEESVQRTTLTQKLNSQVLEAKYANSPNWKRVEKVYAEAKQDILKTLKNLKMDSKQKDVLYKRLESVELSLPYPESDGLNASEECGTTEENAFFIPTQNKFTVCAGLFNAYQTEAGLYKVIAHELAHAVDSGNNSYHQQDKDPLSKDLSALILSPKAPYSCDKWNSIVERAKKKIDNKTPYKDPLQPLYDCLAPKDELDAIDPAVLKSTADSKTKRRLGIFADSNSYVLLTQETTTNDDGTKSPNQYYLRPDRLRAKYNDSFKPAPHLESAEPYEILNQSLACTKASDRATQLDQALKETSTIMSAVKYNQYLYCTVNCDDLQDRNMSLPSGENYADWLANKSFGEFLERKKDLRSRREAIGITNALFCEPPSLNTDAEDLAKIQKKYSLEEHPEDSLRRTSTFNDRNAKLVECEVNKKDQGFGTCEPK